MQEKNSECFRGIRKSLAQKIAHDKENKAKEKIKHPRKVVA